MAQRLIDLYQPGDTVEVLLSDEEATEWRRARVLGHQPPGIWVVAEEDRRLWFVTNGKRIRPVSPTPHPTAS